MMWTTVPVDQNVEDQTGADRYMGSLGESGTIQDSTEETIMV